MSKRIESVLNVSKSDRNVGVIIAILLFIILFEPLVLLMQQLHVNSLANAIQSADLDGTAYAAVVLVSLTQYQTLLLVLGLVTTIIIAYIGADTCKPDDVNLENYSTKTNTFVGFLAPLVLSIPIFIVVSIVGYLFISPQIHDILNPYLLLIVDQDTLMRYYLQALGIAIVGFDIAFLVTSFFLSMLGTATSNWFISRRTLRRYRNIENVLNELPEIERVEFKALRVASEYKFRIETSYSYYKARGRYIEEITDIIDNRDLEWVHKILRIWDTNLYLFPHIIDTVSKGKSDWIEKYREFADRIAVIIFLIIEKGPFKDPWYKETAIELQKHSEGELFKKYDPRVLVDVYRGILTSIQILHASIRFWKLSDLREDHQLATTIARLGQGSAMEYISKLKPIILHVAKEFKNQAGNRGYDVVFADKVIQDCQHIPESDFNQ